MSDLVKKLIETADCPQCSRRGWGKRVDPQVTELGPEVFLIKFSCRRCRKLWFDVVTAESSPITLLEIMEVQRLLSTTLSLKELVKKRG